MNWYKIAQQEKKIEIIDPNFKYKGKFNKVIINIPELKDRIYYYIRNDVRRKIDDLINMEGQKWLLKLKNFNKKKTGSGDITWLMFYRFKGSDKYWIDPIVIETVAEGLDKIGYDVSELVPHARSIESTIPDIKNIEIQNEYLTIQFDGYLSPRIKNQIKDIGFRGKKIGQEFYWTKSISNLEEMINTISFLENLEFDISELQNLIMPIIQRKLHQLNFKDLIKIDGNIPQDGSFGDRIIRPLIHEKTYPHIDTETGEIKDFEFV